MLLLAYSFILSRSMFEGHLLNFRGYVLGFSNKPFDKWQRTNPPTTKRPPFSLAYAFFPCNLILNKHAPNAIKYMRSFFCSAIRNVSFLLQMMILLLEICVKEEYSLVYVFNYSLYSSYFFFFFFFYH